MIALDILFIELNSRAIIQNNTLIQNSVFRKNGTIYFIRKNSSIQLYHVVFIRNKWKYCLLAMKSNSSAIIRNNVLIENNSWRVYNAVTNSRIQLNHVVFKRNILAQGLLYTESNSSAIIQNNTLIKNNISWLVYGIVKNSSIQLNHVEFSRNKFDQALLFIAWNSSAIIQNNILIENNISLFLNIMSYSNAIIQNGNLTENNLIYTYQVKNNSTIQLINVTFIGNVLQKNFLTVVSSSRATLINISMVENTFNRMFVAHSSDLEIDTIFIKKNALYQLIWVAKCKVSFELMKIRENNVTFDMIYAENSAGRITNTYIENFNNILVSAFRTTCTFLGNGNIYFEITNITITVLWSSEVLTFAPPIIQLCGNVSLSNVKLLITSLFEIVKILQYSTKDVLLSENGSVITVTNNYKFSSMFISCTKASVKYIIKSDTFQCIPCARGTYGLNNGSLNTSLSFQSKKITKHESTNFTCLACPVGASCTAFIRSKSNFYGYKTKEQKLKFLPCPSGFCCTGNQCRTINSCNKNRIGTLCGRCIESYVESYLSNECISIHSCKNFPKFWQLYCISASVLATFLYYMKDFITLIKTIVSNFSKIFKPC